MAVLYKLLALVAILTCGLEARRYYEEVDAEGGGTITTPGFPFSYPDNLNSTWVIRAPPRQHVVLLFLVFGIESTENCEFDSVSVYDGEGSNRSLIFSRCGEDIPGPVASSGRALTIVFKSDSSISSSGFKVQYGSTTEQRLEDVAWILNEPATGSSSTSTSSSDSSSPGCGGEFFNENFGEITSPNFPDDYSVSTHCTWVIHAPPGHIVTLYFTVFHLEIDQSCRYDWVKVYSETSQEPIATMCGHRSSSVTTVGDMTIRFRSDDAVTSPGFSARFKIETPTGGRWGNGRSEPMVGDAPVVPAQTGNNPVEAGPSTLANCRQERRASIGVVADITSPNFPHHYPGLANCRWVIRAPEGHRIALAFKTFQVERSTHCQHDWVRVYDGLEGSPVSTYCGQHEPTRPLLSTGNVMVVTFGSDSEGSGRGFRAQYTTWADEDSKN